MIKVIDMRRAWFCDGAPSICVERQGHLVMNLSNNQMRVYGFILTSFLPAGGGYCGTSSLLRLWTRKSNEAGEMNWQQRPYIILMLVEACSIPSLSRTYLTVIVGTVFAPNGSLSSALRVHRLVVAFAGHSTNCVNDSLYYWIIDIGSL
jgi:hypothetical protein